MSSTSQKFIARNRAPRVQIEYDVELYGAQKKVQLPFVMGVMSDLAGKSRVQQPSIDERKFLDIDVDTFDDRMKAMAPRVAFAVPNTLTGEGNLEVDLTFEKMSDFSPAAIASKVDALRPLLEARTQLANLMAYMDGKAGAEALIEKILAEPTLLTALAGAEGGADHGAALDSLRALTPQQEGTQDDSAATLEALRTASPQEVTEKDNAAAVLGALKSAAPTPDAPSDETGGVLDALRSSAPDAAPMDNAAAALDSLAALDPPEEVADDTDDLLADLAAAAPEETEDEDSTSALDSLAALDLPEEVVDDTDDLLADLAAAAPEETVEEDSTSALDNLAALDLPEGVVDDTDDLLADLAADAPEEVDLDTAGDDLDDLLGDLGDEAPDLGVQDEGSAAQEVGSDELEGLLGDLGGASDATSPPEESGQGDDSGTDFDDLDDLLGDLGEDETGVAADSVDSTDFDDLDDLLGELGDSPGGDEGVVPSEVRLTDDPEFAYGTLNSERPTAERLTRKRFRIAILGDFSGRAARGVIETGDALATRRATLLDPDTVEEIIENFATDLVLPLGREGGGVSVPLTGLDDLHPDELYEKVEIFSELASLRGQLASGATTERAAQRLRDWGAAYGTPVRPPRARSGGNAVRADLKLSDFQTLIGATRPQPATPSPMDDLIARIVGPHIRALPDPDAAAMTAAVDRALSSAMRLLLHHPEFQSLEAQWRSLDLIARSVETDDTLELMLYDVSAEEIAADLATHEDLSQSGFARLLTEEPLDEETGRGGYSALIGLYSFEETPPHAELLGRIARVAAHVDAPFLAAISPGFLEVEKRDRPPLVATAWDTLRAMPEAGHLGLLTPRVLLRRPYGAKTEPIHEFAFEEFTMEEGLSGLLWANPAVLAAILLAQSFRRNGPSMGLGSVMSLGGMPYHYVTDRYGDQVALPCTERNLTQSRVEFAMARGFMPVVSIKGRDEVRLASFQSLAGGDILGPWTGVAPPEPSPPTPAAPPASGADDDMPDLGLEGDEAGDDDLDDLLSGFGDDLDPGEDEDDGGIGDMDADLAALLDDL